MNELFSGPRGNELISKDLLEIVRRNGIECPNTIGARDLSKLLQANWLRTTVRADVPQNPPPSEDIELFRKLGMVDAVIPERANYEGTLLLGGYATAMRRRLGYAIKQWKDEDDPLDTGVICFLVGQRPRRMENESDDILCRSEEFITIKCEWEFPKKMPETETGIARLIWEQSLIPHGMFVSFTDTPLQPDGKGGLRNPNTTDTFRAFLNQNPPPGNYLLASSQPFVQRQMLNATNALPVGFNVFEMGPAADPTTPLEIFKDELARLLFELLK